MNILFLTYQGDIAGSTNSIAYLTKGLASRGHNIYMGCRKESLLYSMLENSPVHRIPMTFKSKFDSRNIRQIKEAVENYQIDIINAQSSIDRYTSILAKIKYNLKVKVLHTRRQVSKSSGGVFQSYFYMAGTDKIVAVSQGVKRSLVKKGIRGSHIEIIHNGTPARKYEVLDESVEHNLRKKLHLKSTDFVIGCVARMKNQVQLLHALAKLDFSFKAVFVGVEMREEFEQVISQYGEEFRNKLHFEGMVPTEVMLNYYGLFDLKVLPSTMEGLSQSLLEAMYLKVPVIATRAAGNIDLINDGENGLFFEDGDIAGLAELIDKVYRHEISTQQMIGNAFKTASVDYSIERTINKYETFFASLLTEESELVAAAV